MSKHMQPSFAKGRFLIERELGKGGVGIVYQALDKERNMRVALKTLRHLDTDSLYYFKREFRALHDLVHPNLCSFLELINDDDTWFLTMELIHGVNFLSYVENARTAPGPLSSVVKRPHGPEQTKPKHLPDPSKNGLDVISCSHFDEIRLRKSLAGLCEGLNALHTAGKVHRDIKPSNVMITEENRVVLLDFGLITEKEIGRRTELDAVVGTAAYMAPEQAEAAKVGPEADCYSVGVMLYEALTGHLPFRGPALRILLDKRASDPIRPSALTPGLPEDLDFLCMDLLSRDPKARPKASDIRDIFQTDRPESLLSGAPAIPAFTRGSIFVGRQAELNLLQQAYQDTITDGSFGAIVIEGVSGIGKSALIEQFISDLKSSDPKTVILEGRCYERESAPFKAFDGVIESLIRHIRTIPAAQAVELLPRNSELLVCLFPALLRSEIFSRIPVSENQIEDPHELQNRSFEAMKEVLFRLSGQRPLVVIIDDMQWADVDSQSLLEQLVSDSKAPPMLLIILSRFAKDAEESALDWNSVASQNNKRIHLETLNGKDSEKLARLFIKNIAESCDVDAESIAVEGAGHPLYIAELVNHIAQGGEDWSNLRLDDVIWNRVSALPQSARQLLEIICVAGTPIEREHIQELAGLKSEDFYQCTSLLRASHLIRSRGPRKNHFIEPYHDRVRESVAHSIASSKSTAIQLNIGRFFLKVYKEAELVENIFCVVQHLHAGRELISDEVEKLRLAELYFLAGKKAQGSAAYVSSLHYFRESIDFFFLEGWNTHYDTMVELYSSAAKSAYVTGEFSLTRDLVHKAMSRTKSNLDRAQIYEPYVLSLVADDRPMDAIDEAISMLEKLGLKLPRRPSKFDVLMQFIITKWRLFGKTADRLARLPHTTNANQIATRNLLNLIGDIVYLHLPNFWAVGIMKSVELSIRFGIDHNSSTFFCAWGIIICSFQKKFKVGYQFGPLSLKMLQQFGDNRRRAQLLTIWSTFVQHWTDHIRLTFPNLLESHQIAYTTGNLPYWANSGIAYCYHSFFSGRDLLQVAEILAQYGKEIEQKNQYIIYNMNRIYYQATLNLIGQSTNPTRLEGPVYDARLMVFHHLEKKQRLNLSSYYFCKMLLLVLFNEYQAAWDASRELERFAIAAIGSYQYAVAPFYDSLACLKYLRETDPRTQRKLLRRVRRNQRKYRKVATSSPANHAHKYKFVEAERAGVKGQVNKAPALYDESIAGAIENEFTQDAALACEFAAEYYQEIGDPEKARSYARDALSHYEKWGALAKVEDVRKKFGL